MNAGGFAFGLLVLRLAVGSAVVVHGIRKLFGRFGGHGLYWTAGLLAGLGVKAPRTAAVVLGLAELVGGTSFAAGLLTPLAALAIASAALTGIGLTVRAGTEWRTERDYELDVLVLAGAVGVAAAGSGRASLDALSGWAGPLSGIRWGIGVLTLGVVAAVATLALGRHRPSRVPRAVVAGSPAADGAQAAAAPATEWSLGRSVLTRYASTPEPASRRPARGDAPLEIQVAGADEGSELVAWLWRHGFAASLVESTRSWGVEVRSAEEPDRLLIDIALALGDWICARTREPLQVTSGGRRYSISTRSAG